MKNVNQQEIKTLEERQLENRQKELNKQKEE